MSRTVEERVKDVIAEHLGVDLKEVQDSAVFENLGADSLVMVELMVCLEEEFGTEFPDAEFEKVETVGDVVRCVESRLKESNNPDDEMCRQKLG